MPSAVQVSLAEYLNTDYEPDCDYVDGVLEERNVGQRKHAWTQTRLILLLDARAQEHRQEVLVAQRVQVSRTRVRAPDVCLIEPADTDEVTQHPPALCIEVLSPDDRWSRIQDRLSDYLAFGVRTLWIIDPYSREAWIATQEHAATKVEDGKLRCANLNLEVELKDVLAEH